jgi:outer membrane lipase/esterase
MKVIRTLATAALAAAALALPARADQYSALLVFGDSLSDTGNAYLATGGNADPNNLFGANGAYPTPPYDNGRLSNGPIWVEHRAAGLGLSAAPALAGGTNFAVAGAETGDGFSRLSLLLGQPSLQIPNLNTQVAGFLAAVPQLSGHELISVWAGANDVLIDAQLGQAPDPIALADNVVHAVDTLAAAGGANFLVPNLPNFALLPEAAGFSDAQKMGLNLVSLAFNAELAGGLASVAASRGVEIHSLDVYSLFADAVAHPGDYGFTNVTDNAYDRATGTVAPGVDSYLFWDLLHPTAKTHGILGNAALQAVPEPSAVALCLVGLAGAGLWARRRAA